MMPIVSAVAAIARSPLAAAAAKGVAFEIGRRLLTSSPSSEGSSTPRFLAAAELAGDITQIRRAEGNAMSTQIVPNGDGGYTIKEVNSVGKAKVLDALKDLGERCEAQGITEGEILLALGERREWFSPFGAWCKVHGYMMRFLGTSATCLISLFGLFQAALFVKEKAMTLQEWVKEKVGGIFFDGDTTATKGGVQHDLSKITGKQLYGIVTGIMPTPIMMALNAMSGAASPKEESSAPGLLETIKEYLPSGASSVAKAGSSSIAKAGQLAAKAKPYAKMAAALGKQVGGTGGGMLSKVASFFSDEELDALGYDADEINGVNYYRTNRNSAGAMDNYDEDEDIFGEGV